MSTATMTIEQRIDLLKQQCNDYCQTVQALKAVAHELCWNSNAKSPILDAKISFGRRFDTSNKNRVTPDSVVTPDLTITYPSRNYGLLAEAKIALSNKPEVREERLVSLQKYDDDLFGWPIAGEKIAGHDVLVVVHYTRAFEVKKQIESLIGTSKITFDRPFGIMSFVVQDQVRTFLTIHLVSGFLSDKKVTARLQNPVSIRLEHIACNPKFAAVELYDARPPMALMMDFLYRAIQMTRKQEDLDSVQDAGAVVVELSVDELVIAVGRCFGPAIRENRDPEIPARNWVIEALSGFVGLEWATWVAPERDLVRYELKKRRQPLEKFLHYCARMDAEAEREASKLAEIAELEPMLFTADGKPSPSLNTAENRTRAPKPIASNIAPSIDSQSNRPPSPPDRT